MVGRSWPISARATEAPRRANSFAIAKPMFLAPPVMSAFFPPNSFFSSLVKTLFLSSPRKATLFQKGDDPIDLRVNAAGENAPLFFNPAPHQELLNPFESIKTA